MPALDIRVGHNIHKGAATAVAKQCAVGPFLHFGGILNTHHIRCTVGGLTKDSRMAGVLKELWVHMPHIAIH